MKMKYYLRGLGTGILVATLILGIAFSIEPSNKNTVLEKQESSSSSILKNDDTEKESSENITTNIAENRETTEESKTEETTTEETTTEETTEETTTEKVTPQVTTALPEQAVVVLDIYSGMSSNKVARQLEQLGVISDDNDFNQYLYDNRLENKISVGQFQISQGASYEEIASIITKH